MTRQTQSSLTDLLARPLTAGLAAGLADVLIAWFQRGEDGLPLGYALAALRLTFGLVAAAYLVLFALLALPLGRAGASGPALRWSIGLGLVALVVDAGMLRWDTLRQAPWNLSASAPTALVIALSAYLVARRLTAKSEAERGNAPRAVVFALAALVLLAPLFVAPPSGPSLDGALDREVTSGHGVPRVLLIVADTLRADALSCYADEPDAVVTTPVLDALAAESVRFTDVRAPAPWTLPSMVSLMTGLNPLVHRATKRGSRLPAGLPTLAGRLARAGYRTGAIGHNSVLTPGRGLNRGFDTYDFGADPRMPARSFGLAWVARLRFGATKQEVDAAELNRRAFAWLDEHGEEDFFLWLHYYDPHLVYEPPADLLPRLPRPAGRRTRFDLRDLSRTRSGHDAPLPPDRAWIRGLYDGEVRSLDRELGELFDDLKARGLWEDTLVVFTSDHGEEFWEHEGFEHGHTVYDEVVRVPLLVKLPGAPAPAVVTTPVSLENVAPTVLALCGLRTPRDELSASPLFNRQGALRDAPASPLALNGNLYFQDRVAVVFDGWKYVRLWVTGDEELYDLDADPEEKHNLVPLAPPELARGRARLDLVLAEAEALSERLGVRAEETDLGSEELRRLQELGYAAR